MQDIKHGQTIIELSDVSFSYGDDAILRDFSLDVHRGDYLGVIGPNGGGKTTLLKIMLGLLTPGRGTVKLFGTDIRRFRQWSRVGYVSQKATQIDPAFPITVEGVVGMGRYGKRGPFRFLNQTDREKVAWALKEVEMESYSTHRIGDLSGGQQQRVCLARALAGEPQVIVLDEPTVGVDMKAQDQFYALLRKLNTQMGITLIMALHDLDIIEREATELICINRSLVYCGLPKEFRAHEHFAEAYNLGEKFAHH